MSVYAGPADWWTNGTNDGRYHIDTKGVVQANLIFQIDSGVTQSYPGSGTSWTDLESSPLNATIQTAAYGTDFGGSFTTTNTVPFCTLGTLPLASKLSLTQNFSIEQVFSPSGYQANNYFLLTNQLLVKGNASTYNYATQLANNTTATFIKRTTGEPLQYHNFTVPAMLNKINVLVFVIESNTTVKCYMNGSLIGSLTVTGTAISAIDNDPAAISPDITGNDESVFIGKYYSCRVYNAALTANQVLQNFNAIRGRYGI